MSKGRLEYKVKDLEKANDELMRILVYVCEKEIANRSANSKPLQHATVVVKESIQIFLTLVSSK